MADARYSLSDDDEMALLRKILSPAEAQGLVASASAPAAPRHSPADLFGARVEQKTGGGNAARVKIVSMGMVGYLPKANLEASKKIDPKLRVLEEG